MGSRPRLDSCDKDCFWFDLIVSSTDGSPLVGPVLFHLHDSYVRETIRIKKILNNEAVLTGVDATEVFTAAAQAMDKDGTWVGLEYNLALLPDLPKRFGGPGLNRKGPPPSS